MKSTTMLYLELIESNSVANHCVIMISHSRITRRDG